MECMVCGNEMVQYVNEVYGENGPGEMTFELLVCENCGAEVVTED